MLIFDDRFLYFMLNLMGISDIFFPFEIKLNFTYKISIDGLLWNYRKSHFYTMGYVGYFYFLYGHYGFIL